MASTVTVPIPPVDSCANSDRGCISRTLLSALATESDAQPGRRGWAHRAYLDPDLVRAVARYWARQLPASVVFAEPFEVVRAAEPSIL